MNYDYDLFVIGAGSGGVRASRMAAKTGAKVAVAESSDLGGTCVNLGCVPKKLMVYSSEYSEEFEQCEGYGWEKTNTNASHKFNWNTLISNKDAYIKRLNNIYGDLLNNAGCEIINGKASLVDAHTVSVNNKNYTAEKILIATGGWPFIPDFEGSEHAITSNEVFHLKELPKKVLVVGGGYIAVEFAGIFNGLGSDVMLSYRGPVFLRKFDMDIREKAAVEIAKKGVNLNFESNVTKITKLDNGMLETTFDNGEKFESNIVLYATGRKPNLDGLNLDKTGVKLNDSGHVITDYHFKTSVDSIYALGDIIGTPELTPVAIEQAMAFVSTQYLNKPKVVDYTNIPTAVFCQPNIGTVGLIEEDARKKYDNNISIYKSEFKYLKHTLSGSEQRTFMKLIVDKKTDKIIGAHMLGGDAGEIIQGMGVALKAGATKEIFDLTIAVHPTAAEEFVTMREES
jgi:glutathione reductase (NADPH)